MHQAEKALVGHNYTDDIGIHYKKYASNQ